MILKNSFNHVNEFFTFLINQIRKIYLHSSIYNKKISKIDDKILQYTTCGIHKDDLIFRIGDFLIKKQGSQGQQKTYLIALKTY